MLFLSFLCVLCFIWVPSQAETEPYIVPEARIEVFRPRGIRISIPDYPGIRLFAVHAVFNRDLNGLEAGDISRDVLKKTGDRWVFEDNKLKLNYGDVMNYWLFVIKGHLGYRLDDQTFTVNDFQQAPEGFLNNKRPYKTTTTSPFMESQPQYIPASTLPPFACPCPAPTTPPPCSASTTSVPPAAPAQIPADLVIWRELLVNLSSETANLRNEVAVLYRNNQLLVNKLQRIGDENLTKLRLEGNVLQGDTPISVVRTILVEKLRILNTSIVKNAERNPDGSITFEMRTVDEKLLVLREARDKLAGSKFSIQDIDAISFMNNPDKVQIDMRSQ